MERRGRRGPGVGCRTLLTNPTLRQATPRLLRPSAREGGGALRSTPWTPTCCGRVGLRPTVHLVPVRECNRGHASCSEPCGRRAPRVPRRARRQPSAEPRRLEPSQWEERRLCAAHSRRDGSGVPPIPAPPPPTSRLPAPPTPPLAGGWRCAGLPHPTNRGHLFHHYGGAACPGSARMITPEQRALISCCCTKHLEGRHDRRPLACAVSASSPQSIAPVCNHERSWLNPPICHFPARHLLASPPARRTRCCTKMVRQRGRAGSTVGPAVRRLRPARRVRPTCRLATLRRGAPKWTGSHDPQSATACGRAPRSSWCCALRAR